MTALITIAWLVCLLVALGLVFQFVGLRAMMTFFPEGRRWWIFPAQLASLAFFAAVVLCHPFSLT